MSYQGIKIDAVAFTNAFMEFVWMRTNRLGVPVKKLAIGLGALLSIFAVLASLGVLAIGFGDGVSGWYAVVVLGGALYCARFFFSNPK